MQNEEGNGTFGTIYEDAGLGTQAVFSNTAYQLEDTAIIQCPLPAGGCPATQGFWHKPLRTGRMSARMSMA